MKIKTKQSGRLTAAARRAQLIEVGREVFAERGYGATSIEEIAARFLNPETDRMCHSRDSH